MVTANKDVFARLADFAGELITPDERNKIRYITTNEEEKKWLKSLKVESKQSILPRLATSLLSFEDKLYLVIVGWDSNKIKTGGSFVPEELNAGMMTALVQELSIPIRQHASSLEMMDTIFSQSQEEMPDDYTGHTVSEIIPFFEPVTVYQILDDSPVSGDDIVRLSTLFISQNPQNLILPFSSETIEVFQDIVTNGSESIPYESFLLSLTSFSWRYAFLGIYQCLERLFPVPFLRDVFNNLSMNSDFSEFVNQIERNMGWRANEKEAIRRFFRNASDEVAKIFYTLKVGDEKDIDQAELEKLADWFYEVRNSIVHFRFGLPELKFDNTQWDLLLRGTILLTEHVYALYDKEIKKIKKV